MTDDAGNSTELRTECPREVVDVLDAVSLAKRLTRGQMVVAILSDWARDRQHEASLIARLGRGNPAEPAGDGKQRAGR